MTEQSRQRVAAFAKIQASTTRIKYMFPVVEPRIIQLSDVPEIPVLLNQANKI